MVGGDGSITTGYSGNKLLWTLGLLGMQLTPPCSLLLSLGNAHLTPVSHVASAMALTTPRPCALQFVQQSLRQDHNALPARHWTVNPLRSVSYCLRAVRGPPISRNGGQCVFSPGSCPRRHIRATCGSGQHRARDCRDTPADSRFRRRSARQSRPPVAFTTPASGRYIAEICLSRLFECHSMPLNLLSCLCYPSCIILLLLLPLIPPSYSSPSPIILAHFAHCVEPYQDPRLEAFLLRGLSEGFRAGAAGRLFSTHCCPT